MNNRTERFIASFLIFAFRKSHGFDLIHTLAVETERLELKIRESVDTTVDKLLLDKRVSP